jgi:hypothetical protein
MRQPVSVSISQVLLSQGASQLICTESGSSGAQYCFTGDNAKSSTTPASASIRTISGKAAGKRSAGSSCASAGPTLSAEKTARIAKKVRACFIAP